MQSHVLAVVSQLITELHRADPSDTTDFSMLVERDRFARNTSRGLLPDIDYVLAAANSLEGDLLSPSLLERRRIRLDCFLTALRNSVDDPATRVSLAALLLLAAHDSGDAHARVARYVNELLSQFRAYVGVCGIDDFLLIIEPILFQSLLSSQPLSHDYLEIIVERETLRYATSLLPMIE